jgi:hypothetical protein
VPVPGSELPHCLGKGVDTQDLCLHIFCNREKDIFRRILAGKGVLLVGSGLTVTMGTGDPAKAYTRDEDENNILHAAKLRKYAWRGRVSVRYLKSWLCGRARQEWHLAYGKAFVMPILSPYPFTFSLMG